MSDPTSGNDDRNDIERCINCGARIDTGEWHPVGATRGDDGELVLVQFCTQTCREAWSSD